MQNWFKKFLSTILLVHEHSRFKRHFTHKLSLFCWKLQFYIRLDLTFLNLSKNYIRVYYCPAVFPAQKFGSDISTIGAKWQYFLLLWQYFNFDTYSILPSSPSFNNNWAMLLLSLAYPDRLTGRLTDRSADWNITF